jgi:hypothetical protein
MCSQACPDSGEIDRDPWGEPVHRIQHASLGLGRHFAAFKNYRHYPPVSRDAALIRELEPFRGEKGNLSFAHHQPLPIELIGRVAVALHREYALK